MIIIENKCSDSMGLTDSTMPRQMAAPLFTDYNGKYLVQKYFNKLKIPSLLLCSNTINS